MNPNPTPVSLISQSSLSLPYCPLLCICSVLVQLHTCFLPPGHPGPWPENSFQKRLASSWSTSGQWSPDGHMQEIHKEHRKVTSHLCVVSSTCPPKNPLKGGLAFRVYHYLKLYYRFACRFRVCLPPLESKFQKGRNLVHLVPCCIPST